MLAIEASGLSSVCAKCSLNASNKLIVTGINADRNTVQLTIMRHIQVIQLLAMYCSYVPYMYAYYLTNRPFRLLEQNTQYWCDLKGSTA